MARTTRHTEPDGKPPSPWVVANGGIGARWRAARNGLRHLGLLWPRRSRTAYVGWLGFGNMGDEAMFAACGKAFHPERLTPVQNARAVRLLDAVSVTPVARRALLGGGTLIGRSSYRRTIEQLLKSCPSLGLFSLGTGVVSPDFRDGDAEDRSAVVELARWAPLLRDFHRVNVRGPLSRDILRSYGVAASVVGDPALLLGDPAAGTQVRRDLVGVNVGITRALWGSDPDRLLEEIAAGCRLLIARGYAIRLVPMWPPDVPYIEETARRIGSPRVELVRDFGDLGRLLAAIGECYVFVGQKLHSVVLAAATHVPAVMVEYQPKCLDFQESIGRQSFTIRTDELRADGVVSMVEELAEQRAQHSRAIEEAVARLRSRLIAEVEVIRTAMQQER